METSFYTGPRALNNRILIVDDNPAIHADFRKILAPETSERQAVDKLEAALFNTAPKPERAAQFQLDSAYQGQEALELVKKSLAENRPYALAFVDVRMPPGWDGIETVARIWETYPDLQVVVCTAYSDYSWEDMRLKVGQADNLVILKKPFYNIEVIQLAHSLTKKWLLNLQANFKRIELEEMVSRRTAELEVTNEDLRSEIQTRIKAEDSLRVSEERFSRAFHGSPVAMAIQSLPELQFMAVNERFLKLVGRPQGEIIGCAPAELKLWQKSEQAGEWYARLARQEDVRDQEARVQASGEIVRDVLVSLSPITLAGQPHALLLVQDVTERLVLERQLRHVQKLDAVGQLAAGVAHDFNNVLTVIQGHAGLLMHGLGGASPHHKSAEQVSKAATRAAAFVRQLLLFSRKQVTQPRHLDFNEATRNSLDMLKRLVGENIELDFSPGESLPAIYADAGMMEQILMNLAVNARDAMPEGGRLSVGTQLCWVDRAPTALDPEPRHGGFVCLTFADTGCGMDTKILNRLFEPFFTTKGVGKGTGLGLATVYGIAKHHHGWIEVESAVGKGTTFRIFFPVSNQLAEARPAVQEAELKCGRETVLVAEDEGDLRDMVTQVLRIQGYKVLTASSGPKALKLAEDSFRQIDLLVTDMVMPEGMSGGELADRLCARNPRIKVIYTSGYTPGMAGKDVQLLEGRNFLPKPYSIGKLAQFVRDCLDTTTRHNCPMPAEAVA